MGLTIHYELRMQDRTKPETVIARVKALRQACLDMPFEEVGEVLHLNGDEANYEKVGRDDPKLWLLIQARYTKMEGKRFLSCFPSEAVCFSTWPGEGCEEANFGLCRYPGLKGWHWSSFCKTQYAKDFAKCHLLVVRTLDKARELRILKKVHDEGEYWESRNPKILGKSLEEYNGLVAAFGGAMKDALEGSGMEIVSPIFENPGFEKMEHEGRKKNPGIADLMG